MWGCLPVSWEGTASTPYLLFSSNICSEIDETESVGTAIHLFSNGS